MNTYENLLDVCEENNLKLLSKEKDITNIASYIKFKCKNCKIIKEDGSRTSYKEICKASSLLYDRKNKCPNCKKYNNILDFEEKTGLVVISPINNIKYDELLFECQNGHTFKKNFYAMKKRLNSKIKKNYNNDNNNDNSNTIYICCNECNGVSTLRNKTHIYRDLVRYCQLNNFTLQTELKEFGGRKSRIWVKCNSCGESDDPLYESFTTQRKDLCQICKNGRFKERPRKRENIYKELEKEIKKNNIIILTENHENISTNDYITYKCSNGHIFKRKYTNFRKSNFECKECAKNNCFKYKKILANSNLHSNIFENWNEQFPKSIDYILKKLSEHKIRDLRRNRDNDITYEWVLNQYVKQNGKCIYTNKELDLTGENKLYALSIDRKDNSKGHIEDNCVLIIRPINYLKYDRNHDDFLIWLYQLWHNDNEQNNKPTKKIIIDKYKNIKYNTNVIYKLILKQKNKCQITGVPLCWESNCWNSGCINKINLDKDRTQENLQILLKYIGYMKKDLFTNRECHIIMNNILKPIYENYEYNANQEQNLSHEEKNDNQFEKNRRNLYLKSNIKYKYKKKDVNSVLDINEWLKQKEVPIKCISDLNINISKELKFIDIENEEYKKLEKWRKIRKYKCFNKRHRIDMFIRMLNKYVEDKFNGKIRSNLENKFVGDKSDMDKKIRFKCKNNHKIRFTIKAIGFECPWYSNDGRIIEWCNRCCDSN